MGLLVEGVWQDQWYDTGATGGRFVRTQSQFRHWVTPDGAPGPTGEGGFPATAGRYHLYVSLACPWAHRTLILRALKRLEAVVSLSIVSPHMGRFGWTFDTTEGSTGDALGGAGTLAEIYVAAEPRYTGRVTVPVLWDHERRTIVSNESADILRMLNGAFRAFTDVERDYCPDELLPQIDEINAFVYANINNGVYRAGFATTQAAYEEAFRALFAALDEVEERLSARRFLVGARLTEADWRLFTTLIRFDAVYFGHFKCNLRRIVDYPNLSNYLLDLYQVPGVAGTVDLDHIKRHYYGSHTTINPTGIVPVGPALDFSARHDRGRFGPG
jgi:glutathionyl-hydroquinone reductase